MKGVSGKRPAFRGVLTCQFFPSAQPVKMSRVSCGTFGFSPSTHFLSTAAAEVAGAGAREGARGGGEDWRAGGSLVRVGVGSGARPLPPRA